MVLSLLRQFPGYTLGTLMKEDTELIRLVAIETQGTNRKEADGDGE